MSLSCGHPDAALEYGSGNPGDPVRCGFCRELADVRQESIARSARVVRLFSEIAHEMPGVPYGEDAAGLHVYEANDPRGCPVCEALDQVLGDARNTLDVILSPEQRAGIQWFQESGLLWLVNTAILHPRGKAIAVHVDENGERTAMSIVGDGDEPWTFGPDAIDSFRAYLESEAERESEWSSRLRVAADRG